MRRLLKKLSFVVLLLAIVFVPALLVSATGEISVKVSMYTAESNPSVSNIERGLGFRQSITPPGGSTFAYFALNGYVSEKLASDYQFPVRTKTEIDAYYHPAGQYVVIFADSNNKVLDVKYVTSGQTVSVTAANTAAASLVKYGMTLNGESTRWKTSDNVGPEDAITSNRIFYAQYTVTNVDTFALTVNGGTSDKATYAFNEVATLTANADNGSGVPFSHWEDVDGNVLSTKSVYKFTMHKITTVNAVFAASSEYSVPVVNMSDAIVLRADTVSYMGQFDLPDGYTFVESGFLFSRSSMVLEKTSLGVTVAQSNVHNSTTKEYLMTFSDELFNSIRAYVTVQRTSDSAIITCYSENVYRNPASLGESGTYSAGFDTASKTAYALGTIIENGVTWTLDDALVGTDVADAKVGSKSVRIRNSGSLYIMSGFASISSISFKAGLYGTDATATVSVFVSSDGSNWIDVTDGLESNSVTSASLSDFTLNLQDSNNYLAEDFQNTTELRVKISKTGGNRVNIDEVNIVRVAYTGSIHEVIFNNEDALETSLVAHNETVSAPSVSKTGHTLDGWFSNVARTIQYNFSTPVQQSFTLYSKWSINQYTISFNSNSGSAVSAITQDYNTAVSAPSAPTRPGYTFAGWYSDSELTQAYTFSTMPAESITVYAKWNINQYTITFDSNEGSAVSAITQDYNTAVSAPVNPTRDGYSFEGWFSDEELTESYTFSTMPAGNITLYAAWEELVGTYYTVTFNSNGGSAVSSQQVLSGGLAILPDPAPTKSGYSFMGWQTVAEVSWNFESNTVTEAITLYADWDLITYNITYSNLESTSHSNPATYTVETSTITLTDPSAREGYSFVGWFTELSGGSEVETIVIGSIGHRTVYARWNAILSDYSETITLSALGLQASNQGTYVTLTNYVVGEGLFTGRVARSSAQVSVGGVSISKIQTNSSATPFITYTAKNGYYVYSIELIDVNAAVNRTLKIGSITIASVTTSAQSYSPYLLPDTQTSFTLTPSGAIYIGSIIVVCKPINP